MNLSELITTHKGDRSYEKLEADCGGTPSAQRLQQLATKPQKNFPDPPTIEALSIGLRVPAIAVVMAAAESLGLDVKRAMPALLDRLPAGIENLSEHQMRVVADLTRTFIQVNEATGLQEVLLRNFMLDTGVHVFESSGVEVERPDAFPRLFATLLDLERHLPGYTSTFYGELVTTAEEIDEHAPGRYFVAATLPDSPRAPISVEPRELPEGVTLRHGLRIAARGPEDEPPTNQSNKP